MAFQANAFQSNAFQISASQIDIPLQRRRRRLELEREYLAAQKALEELKDKAEYAEITIQEKKLEAIIKPFVRHGEPQISMLAEHQIAKQELEKILLSIRQLEEDMLMILALLLLANEEL